MYVLHAPILCRDYLLDTFMWKNKIVPEARIYGYTFNGNYDPNYMWVDCLPNLEKNLDFFHSFEDKAGIPRTQVFKCDKGWLFKADDQWVNSTLRISIWTWMIRNFLYPAKPNVLAGNEDFTKRFPELMELPFHKHVCKPSYLKDIHLYHSYNGFQTVLNPHTKEYTVYGNTK